MMTMPAGVLRFAAVMMSTLAIGAASIAYGQVYKCTDDAGKTTYADTPCARAGKPLAIQDPAKTTGAGPVVCAQLLDEIHRLEGIAERGRTGLSQRGKTLQREYAARCLGITRSPAPPQ